MNENQGEININNNNNNNNANNNNNTNSSSSNYYLSFTILLVIIIFIIIEILELASNVTFLIKTASRANNDNVIGYFNQCIKYTFIFKIWFIIYSLSASISACVILICILIDISIDISILFEKFAYTFIKLNYFMFGPLLCGLTAFALIYHNKTMMLCNNINSNLSYVQFSPGLLTNTLTFFILSIIITLAFEGYESFNYIVDSILNKPNASIVIHYLFWRRINGRENQLS